jgi:REP element-mobilizing transposase RayT
MARPWRIEYEGALYHVFSRSNNHQDIFVTDDDRYLFLNMIGQISERFGSVIFAFVLMDNHYHLLLRTPKANLSRSMQWLDTELILTQIYGKNKHRQFREKSQKYSEEHRRI